MPHCDVHCDIITLNSIIIMFIIHHHHYQVRRRKAEGSFDRTKSVFTAPLPPVDRSSLVNRFAIEPSRNYIISEHSGKWEFSRSEGRHMWSDTASFEFESPGDITTVINPDKYNFEGPNMAPPPRAASRRLRSRGTGAGAGCNGSVTTAENSTKLNTSCSTFES